MTRMFQKHFIQINYLTKAITRFGPDGYHLVGTNLSRVLLSGVSAQNANISSYSWNNQTNNHNSYCPQSLNKLS